LLAAINSSVSAPKAQSKAEAIKSIKQLNQDRGVNSRVAHDLISNASKAGEYGDLKDFAGERA